MRWTGFSLVALLTACSASPDTNPGEESGGSNATGGSAGKGSAGASGAGTTSGGSTASGGKSGAGSGGASAGSGGSSSGAGGSGGTVPIMVTDCGALPEVGKWELIDPPEFASPDNMEVLSVVVAVQDQSVYASAGNKTNGGNGGTGVLKSTDCGATWSKVSTGMNGDKLDSGDQWAMMIDPTNPQILYSNNGYGNDPTLYKSTNGGVDFTALLPHPDKGVASFVQDIAMDPEDPEHIAVSFHGDCEKAGFNAMCFSRSTDGGASWALFNGPASIGGWQEGAALSILGPTHYMFSSNAGGWFTDDEGANWDHVIDSGFNGAYGGSTTIADGTVYLAGDFSIYMSSSNPLGASWTKIDGSPHVTVITNDGDHLIASNGGTDPHPMWMADVGAVNTWTQMTDTPDMGRGANQMAYDPVHHIVYSADWAAGLWRMVSQ
ncbi:MAG TPA: hypothetical protein VGP93_14125 [Polyangiaceae bacterium]|nr:hypothetical protein [Polyangiaceae bacterium]